MFSNSSVTKYQMVWNCSFSLANIPVDFYCRESVLLMCLIVKCSSLTVVVLCLLTQHRDELHVMVWPIIVNSFTCADIVNFALSYGWLVVLPSARDGVTLVRTI